MMNFLYEIACARRSLSRILFNSIYSCSEQITGFICSLKRNQTDYFLTIDDLFSTKKSLATYFIVARLKFIFKINPKINNNLNGYEEFVPPCRPFNRQPGPAVPFPLFQDSP